MGPFGFTVMGKPENKSSFALAGVFDAQVLLWQDWQHKDSSILFEDILALVVGERIDIRVPHQKNISFRNTSPLFFTSNSALYVLRHDADEMFQLNAAMAVLQPHLACAASESRTCSRLPSLQSLLCFLLLDASPSGSPKFEPASCASFEQCKELQYTFWGCKN